MPNRWEDAARLRHLEGADRDRWFPRARILSWLELAEGAAVADIGAGAGFLVGELAVAVGRAGRVLAVDPSPAARARLMERFGDGTYPQVVVSEGRGESTGLDDRSVDRMVWMAVYHEFSDVLAAFREARRVLKPDGRLVVADWKPEASGIGPPSHERMPRAHAEATATAAGFRRVGGDDLSEVCWGLVLEPSGE